MIPSAERMTTTFIHHPGLSGPFGALMDEYERAERAGQAWMMDERGCHTFR